MSRPKRLNDRLWKVGNDSQKYVCEVLWIDSVNDATACHERHSTRVAALKTVMLVTGVRDAEAGQGSSIAPAWRAAPVRRVEPQ